MNIIIYKSYFLLRLTLASHVFLIPALWLLPWAILFKAVLVSIVVLSLLWQMWFETGQATRTLKLEDDGSCLLFCGAESVDTRFQIESAHLHAGMLRLVLKNERFFSRSLIIAQDAVTPADYRELRTRILQRRLPLAITETT